MLFLLLAAVKHPPGQQPVSAWEAQALTLCFLGRFCPREQSGPLCGWPRRQRPGCLLGAVCRRSGLEQLRRGWAVPPPAKVPGALSRRRLSGRVENGTREWGEGASRGGSRCCLTRGVQVCLRFCVTLSFADQKLLVLCASAASLGAFFFSFSFYHLYSLFSFLRLQGCLQQSSGRQCYLAAQPVPLLSLQYLVCSNAWLEQGPHRGVRPLHTHPCPPTPAALPSGRDTSRATVPAGRAGEGQLPELDCKKAPGEIHAVFAGGECH